MRPMARSWGIAVWQADSLPLPGGGVYQLGAQRATRTQEQERDTRGAGAVAQRRTCAARAPNRGACGVRASCEACLLDAPLMRHLDPQDERPQSSGKRKIKRWSAEEHEQLIRLVEQHGEDACWATIAQHIPGRTGKQCRERWVNHIGCVEEQGRLAQDPSSRATSRATSPARGWPLPRSRMHSGGRKARAPVHGTTFTSGGAPAAACGQAQQSFTLVAAARCARAGRTSRRAGGRRRRRHRWRACTPPSAPPGHALPTRWATAPRTRSKSERTCTSPGPLRRPEHPSRSSDTCCLRLSPPPPARLVQPLQRTAPQ